MSAPVGVARTAMGTGPRRCRPPPAISRCRSPSCGPGHSSRCCWSDAAASNKALHAVIMEAYVHGVSTRSVDDLVAAMGFESGMSKSEVSRISRAWTARSTPSAPAFCKVRVGAHVVSQAPHPACCATSSPRTSTRRLFDQSLTACICQMHFHRGWRNVKHSAYPCGSAPFTFTTRIGRQLGEISRPISLGYLRCHAHQWPSSQGRLRRTPFAGLSFRSPR